MGWYHLLQLRRTCRGEQRGAVTSSPGRSGGERTKESGALGPHNVSQGRLYRLTVKGLEAGARRKGGERRREGLFWEEKREEKESVTWKIKIRRDTSRMAFGRKCSPWLEGGREGASEGGREVEAEQVFLGRCLFVGLWNQPGLYIDQHGDLSLSLSFALSVSFALSPSLSLPSVEVSQPVTVLRLYRTFWRCKVTSKHACLIK